MTTSLLLPAGISTSMVPFSTAVPFFTTSHFMVYSFALVAIHSLLIVTVLESRSFELHLKCLINTFYFISFRLECTIRRYNTIDAEIGVSRLPGRIVLRISVCIGISSVIPVSVIAPVSALSVPCSVRIKKRCIVTLIYEIPDKSTCRMPFARISSQYSFIPPQLFPIACRYSHIRYGFFWFFTCFPTFGYILDHTSTPALSFHP